MQKIARSSFIPWNRRAVAVAFGDYNAYIYVYLVRRHRYYHHLHQHHHHRRRRGVAAYIVRRCDVYFSIPPSRPTNHRQLIRIQTLYAQSSARISHLVRAPWVGGRGYGTVLGALALTQTNHSDCDKTHTKRPSQGRARTIAVRARTQISRMSSATAAHSLLLRRIFSVHKTLASTTHSYVYSHIHSKIHKHTHLGSAVRVYYINVLVYMLYVCFIREAGALTYLKWLVVEYAMSVWWIWFGFIWWMLTENTN